MKKRTGESWDDLLKGYTELKKDDIKAVVLYVRASLEGKGDVSAL